MNTNNGTGIFKYKYKYLSHNVSKMANTAQKGDKMDTWKKLVGNNPPHGTSSPRQLFLFITISYNL